jgi:class 3 adenylate cyclase
MTEQLGDREAHKVIRAHNAIVRRELAAHGGREVELQGDGFLAAFWCARRALDCAIAIQQAFATYNETHPERPIRVRIGLHTGEAIPDAGRFFGRTVIVAARIASAALGAEILMSSFLKEVAEGAGEFCFGRERELELKGLTGRHRVCAVEWDGGDFAQASPPRIPAQPLDWARPWRSMNGEAKAQVPRPAAYATT